MLYLLSDQIQLLADLNLKKTPQLVELADDADVTSFYYSFLLGTAA